MKCARGDCGRAAAEHPNGDCPDGKGSFTFNVNPAVVDFIEQNKDLSTKELADKWIERLLEASRRRTGGGR